MNKLQGMNTINDQSSYRNVPLTSSARFSRPRISELIEAMLHVDGNSLAKEIFFSCHKCDGPIVPSAECQVCYRTTYRKCTWCENEVPYGSHQLCEFLILLRELKAEQQKNQTCL